MWRMQRKTIKIQMPRLLCTLLQPRLCQSSQATRFLFWKTKPDPLCPSISIRWQSPLVRYFSFSPCFSLFNERMLFESSLWSNCKFSMLGWVLFLSFFFLDEWFLGVFLLWVIVLRIVDSIWLFYFGAPFASLVLFFACLIRRIVWMEIYTFWCYLL